MRCALAIAVCLLSLAPSGASAQPRYFETQLFLPPAAGGTTFTIARPTTPRHLNAVFGVALNYAHEPFRRGASMDSTGAVVLEGGSIVRNHLQIEAMAALGLFEFIELGLVLPFAVAENVQGDYVSAPTLDTYGWLVARSDLRLSAKVPILRGDFALAARFVAHIPTGDWDQFNGMEYWIATPSLVAAWDPGPLTIGAELGYRLRQRRAIPGYEQDDELAVAVGLNVPIVEEVEIIGETQVRVGVAGRQVRENEEK